MSCFRFGLCWGLTLILHLAPAYADEAAKTLANPFACLGAYEAATRDHTISQMRQELQALMLRQLEPDLSLHQLAVDACVIGRLKARVGDGNASFYFEHAIALAPHEPGYELFAGEYWSNVRGARGPVDPRAVKHLQQGLEKLQRLREAGQAQTFHDLVEDWITKRLMVLHQQDGVTLLPAGDARKASVRLSFASQLRVSQDTRDFFYVNEMRRFALEAAFAGSDVRAAETLDQRDLWDIARAPYRLQSDNRLRLRHRWAGHLDIVHSSFFSPRSQITSFYDPNERFSDVMVTEVGAAAGRAWSLYPLFDLRLVGSYRRVDRKGVVEFEPQRHERFGLLEVRPSVSRFVGSSKVSIDGVYARLALPDMQGVTDQRLREKIIRAVRVNWAIYAPMPLPTSDFGTLGFRPTPIRGWHLFAGAAEDAEAYGLRTVVATDIYAGTQFEGPGRWDVVLQGTYLLGHTSLVDSNDNVPRVYRDPTQDFQGAQASLIPQWRLRDPNGQPGVPGATLGLRADSLMLVFPIQASFTMKGRAHYENVRAGMQLWSKLFVGLNGAAFLVTAGVDVQHFPHLDKTLLLGQVALRLGWWDEL